MAPEDFTRLAVDDLGRRAEVHTHRQHRALADAHALRHLGARADEGTVLDDDRIGLERLEHAADPGTAGQVDVLADLRTAAHGRPGVDHRALTDIGADVHEAGHQDRALGDVRAAPHDRAGHRAEPGGAEIGLRPAAELRRHLVEPVARTRTIVDQDIVVQAERQEDGLLQPLVDGPAAMAVRLGHARLAPVEQRQRTVDGDPFLTLRREVQLGPVFPGGIDGGGQFMCHRQSSNMLVSHGVSAWTV